MPRLKRKRSVLFLLGFFSSLYLISNISLFSKVSHSKVLQTSDDIFPNLEELQTPLQRYIHHVRIQSDMFQCANLFNQDVNEMIVTRNYLEIWNYSFPPFPESDFYEITKECDVFKMELDYYRPVSDKEKEFPLAFSILTHDKIEELERLLRMIYAPQNIYCLHVDLKASPVFLQAVKMLARCFSNVFVSTKLEPVVYEHYSRLRAELNCVEDLLFYSHSWKYMLNFASSEIPLLTNYDLVRSLQRLNGSNDIREVYRGRRPERYKYRYYLVNGTMQKSNQRLPRPPHNLTVTKGLAYGAFSRDFLVFALTDQIAQDFLTWTKDTHSPDEHFWATLNNLYHNPFLHSPGGSTVHPDRKGFISRFVVWKNSARHTCYGKHRHNICIFGYGDLPNLMTSRKLIANKFDVTYDPVAYSCMEELHRNRTRSQSRINL